VARPASRRPRLVLRHARTALLESERALSVMKILNRLAQEFHTVIFVVPHDKKNIPACKRIYHIRDGKAYEESGEGRPI
jgi:putative ABC transport system ATP-binding protein